MINCFNADSELVEKEGEHGINSVTKNSLEHKVFFFIKMVNKVNREVAKDVAKQLKQSKNITAENQGSYVDSSRNIAVCLDSKELANSLKNFERDVGS